ncbi:MULTISPECIES: hypothetical protein [Cupriavidus]
MLHAREVLDFVVINESSRNKIATFMVPGHALAFLQSLLRKNAARTRYTIENLDGAPISTKLRDRVEALHTEAQRHGAAGPAKLFTIFEVLAIADRDAVTFATLYVPGCTPDDAIASYRRRSHADRAWIANDGGQALAVCRAANGETVMTLDALTAWETLQTAPQHDAGETHPAAVTEIRL